MRIVFHVRTGYRDYMRTPEVETLLTDAGHRIADAAGGAEAGFEVDVTSRSGRRRVPRVAVVTATFEAKEAEARDRKLTRALDAGRNV